MAQPVWVLSVDLQTKTATFNTGLADAAKNARASFGDIRDSAKGMSDGVSEAAKDTEYSMTGARHGIVMLGEEFGVHLPRGITTFIASLGPVGAAMEAAFPFLAILLGATLLIEHLTKVGEAAKQAAESGAKAFEKAGESLEEATKKSLELQIKLAELNGGPVEGLRTKLREVDDLLASMKLAPGIKAEFDDLIKSIREPFGGNWNPLNWFGESVAASKEVKAEAQSAALAIANATTLEQKQAAANQELTRAQLELSAIQKSGNADAIEDQQKLIRLLQETKQNMDLQVGNQNTAQTVADEGKADKKSKAESKAAEQLFDDIQKKRIEYEDAVMTMNAAEAKDAEARFKEIEKANAESVDNRMEQEAQAASSPWWN